MNHRIEAMPRLSGPVPVGDKPGAPEPTKFERVAQEFESLLLNELLKSMRATESMLADDKEESAGSNLHREMMDEQLARAMARGGGLGIAKMLEQQLQQRYGKDSP